MKPETVVVQNFLLSVYAEDLQKLLEVNLLYSTFKRKSVLSSCAFALKQ